MITAHTQASWTQALDTTKASLQHPPSEPLLPVTHSHTHTLTHSLQPRSPGDPQLLNDRTYPTHSSPKRMDMQTPSCLSPDTHTHTYTHTHTHTLDLTHTPAKQPQGLSVSPLEGKKRGKKKNSTPLSKPCHQGISTPLSITLQFSALPFLALYDSFLSCFRLFHSFHFTFSPPN